VPLTPLHLDPVAADVPDGRAQAFRAVEHDQQGLIEREPALAQLAEETRDDARVLTGRLHEAQDPLLPRGRHPQRHRELIAGKRLAVEDEHQPLRVVEPPFLEQAQLAGARANAAPRHARPGEPEGFRHRFGGGLVLPTREAAQHPAEEPHILRPRRLQRGIGRQRDFAPGLAIAHARHGDRQFLVGQIDRSALRAPPHHGGARVVAGIPRTGQRLDLGQQRLLDGPQASGISA